MLQANKGLARLSRRAALRVGAIVGTVSAGLAISAPGPRLGPVSAAAQEGPWRKEHLEVDVTPVDAVSMVRAGSGPAQRGDWFYIDGAIYAANDVDGAQIGTYQCFGAWTHAATDTGAPDQRFTSVQFHFQDGAIMGLINEAGADPAALVGAVQGGTGRFVGALGTFQQQTLTGAVAGVTPGRQVTRGKLDLMLPNIGM